jgi:uncharacterized protein
MGRVIQLYRYPIKSMQGERVQRLEFVSGSASGDRQWALVDADSGVFLSAKRHGKLLHAVPRTEADGSVAITLPGGTAVGTLDPAANAVLSDWLGRRVELRSPADGVSPVYEGLTDPTDDDSETGLFQGPSTHFADSADVHLLTTASLAAARAIWGDCDWDVRRFRPTMLLDMGEEELARPGFVEDAWVGSRVVIGRSATFEILKRTVRCNLPTRAQPGLPRDTSVARVLRDHHDFCLGVNGVFRAGGDVGIGDAVVLRPA